MNNFVTTCVRTANPLETSLLLFSPAVVWVLGRRTTDLGDGTSEGRDALHREFARGRSPSYASFLNGSWGTWITTESPANHTPTPIRKTGQQNQPLLGREEKKRETTAKRNSVLLKRTLKIISQFLKRTAETTFQSFKMIFIWKENLNLEFKGSNLRAHL